MPGVCAHWPRGLEFRMGLRTAMAMVACTWRKADFVFESRALI